ncbi:hypothetical protein K438DRAFT_1778449 [Mycena galopus ATCC 62051]|nr:hypothetical protein K438DRAFT_1778449 [Mycena galopus ATCC 62051]
MSLSKPWKGFFDSRDACQQRDSSEIVVYCPEWPAPVKIPWPTVNGFRVPPNLIPKYLLDKHLYWPCFCTHSMGFWNDPNSVSSRFLASSTGETIALCHYFPKARCQFFLDLDKCFQTSTMTYDYMGAHSGNNFDSVLQCILRASMAMANDEEKPVWFEDEARHVLGYLGEQGEQLLTLISPCEFRNIVLLYETHPVVGRLAKGEAVPRDDIEQVLVHCTTCRNVFLIGVQHKCSH